MVFSLFFLFSVPRARLFPFFLPRVVAWRGGGGGGGGGGRGGKGTAYVSVIQ